MLCFPHSMWTTSHQNWIRLSITSYDVYCIMIFWKCHWDQSNFLANCILSLLNTVHLMVLLPDMTITVLGLALRAVLFLSSFLHTHTQIHRHTRYFFHKKTYVMHFCVLWSKIDVQNSSFFFFRWLCIYIVEIVSVIPKAHLMLK